MTRDSTDGATSVGRYIRKHRHSAGLSLRDLADKLEVSHVFLSKIERGKKKLPQHHWKKLAEVVPTITIQELKEYSDFDTPIQMQLDESASADLGLILARKLQRKPLDDPEMRKIIDILEGKE